MFMYNCKIDVARSRYATNTKQTGKPLPNLLGVLANISPMVTSDYARLTTAPEPALKSTHVIIVPSGTDIVTADCITRIWNYPSNQNMLYEGAGPLLPNQPGYGSVVWWVRFYEPSGPGFAAYRSLYVERLQLTGPMS